MILPKYYLRVCRIEGCGKTFRATGKSCKICPNCIDVRAKESLNKRKLNRERSKMNCEENEKE